MDRSKIFEMWEHQFDCLKQMSEAAESAKEVSALTDSMINLWDKLLREVVYGWVQHEKACNLEIRIGSALRQSERLLDAAVAELGSSHRLVGIASDLENKLKEACSAAHEFSEQLSPRFGQKTEEEPT